MVTRQACTACGGTNLEQCLDLGDSPIADAYTTTPSEPTPRYPLRLAVCRACWLVQLLDVVDHRLLFGADYSFYSSASPPLCAYQRDYAHLVLQRHGNLARRLVVEVGCNDGDMLQHFAHAGCPLVGVDPAAGPAKVAAGRGLPVLVEPFNTDTADRLLDAHGPAGVIIANHVLAHVEDVAEVLTGIDRLLAPDGVAYVEVQYLPDLLLNNAFDLVYHEHRNFFTISSLTATAARWGLRPLRAEFTDRQGGSLRVEFARGPVQAEPVLPPFEADLRDMRVYAGLQWRAERLRDRLLTILDTRRAQGPIIGYGAPAKATTLLNYCGIGTDLVGHVIDSTPAKQGRHIPGVNTPIVAPHPGELDRTETVLLLAWNYADRIMRDHVDYTARGGRWVLPIPAPMLL